MNTLRITGLVIWYTVLVAFHICTLGWFVPWWVSIRRHLPNTGPVAVLCIFAPVTLWVTWIIAMAYVVRTKPQS